MSACGRGGEHQLMSDSILSATAAAKEESNRNLGTASLIYVVQIYWIGERDCTVNWIVLWGCNCVFLISQFVQYRFVSVKRHRTRTEFSSVWLDLISRSKRKELEWQPAHAILISSHVCQYTLYGYRVQIDINTHALLRRLWGNVCLVCYSVKCSTLSRIHPRYHKYTPAAIIQRKTQWVCIALCSLNVNEGVNGHSISDKT